MSESSDEEGAEPKPSAEQEAAEQKPSAEQKAAEPKPSAEQKAARAGAKSAGASRGGAGKAGTRRAGARPGAARTTSARDRAEEFESVLSGRLVLATAICLAMVLIPLSPLGRIIAKKAPESAARTEWKVGTKGIVHVTLVTADYDKLDCADKRKVGGMHCAFEEEKKPFPKDPEAPYDDNKRNILQPYRTTDGQLLFLAGLWAQPEISMRLHREPGRNVPEKKLVRFVTECEVEFLEEWQGALYRWSPRDAFAKGETAMVARPVECHIFEGP
jgi:hypothetical protein